jgi:ABC-type uncharacterized transport system permease subunit
MTIDLMVRKSSKYSLLLSYLLAIAAAFVVVGALIWVLGYDPVEAFRTVLSTSFKSKYGFIATLHKWVPTLLLTLAFAIPLSSGKFNIGGEGQLLVGAIGAVAVGITQPHLPRLILLPLALLAGIAAGMLWAGIAAFLMSRFNVNEILSTVLLNFIAFQVVDYVALVIWPDVSAGVAATVPISKNAEMPRLGIPSIHAGVLITLLLSVILVYASRKSALGFELRVAGSNPRAAFVNGVRVKRMAVGGLVAGGAFAGLGGAIEATGVHQRLINGMQSNFLILGIIVALIARGNLAWIPIVAFAISVLEVGASSMQRTVGVPSEMVLIIESLILIFLLLTDVLGPKLRKSK